MANLTVQPPISTLTFTIRLIALAQTVSGGGGGGAQQPAPTTGQLWPRGRA